LRDLRGFAVIGSRVHLHFAHCRHVVMCKATGSGLCSETCRYNRCPPAKLFKVHIAISADFWSVLYSQSDNTVPDLMGGDNEPSLPHWRRWNGFRCHGSGTKPFQQLLGFEWVCGSIRQWFAAAPKKGGFVEQSNGIIAINRSSNRCYASVPSSIGSRKRREAVAIVETQSLFYIFKK
jgi:hypothetical protein